jgi:hypothetical protein
MGPRGGLDGFENFYPTSIRSPDRPARSEPPMLNTFTKLISIHTFVTVQNTIGSNSLVLLKMGTMMPETFRV